MAAMAAVNKAVREYAEKVGLDLSNSSEYHQAYIGAKLNNPELFGSEALRIPNLATAPEQREEDADAMAIARINKAVAAFAEEAGLDLSNSSEYHAAFIGAKLRTPKVFGAASADQR